MLIPSEALRQLCIAALIVAAAAILGRIAMLLIDRVITRWAGWTKTTLDDLIINNLRAQVVRLQQQEDEG